MKVTLLTVLLVLLCVGRAEAFEVHVECKDGKQGQISCTKAAVEKDLCLAKMEEAMRYMEPWTYVKVEFGSALNDYNWLLPFPYSPNEKRGQIFWKRAKELWESTKHDCWQK